MDFGKLLSGSTVNQESLNSEVDKTKTEAQAQYVHAVSRQYKEYEDTLTIALVIGVLLALGQTLCQAFIFLKDGHWPNWSTLAFINRTFDCVWLKNPDSWFGVHKILTFILDNTSVGVLIAALSFCLVIWTSHGRREHAKKYGL